MENREDTELGDLIRRDADYHEAPQSLRESVGLMLARAPATEKPGRAGHWLAWRQWRGIGAAFAAGVVLGVAMIFLHGLPEAQDRLLEQVVDSHVRSLMVAHLADIASSDQHTVKPWLSSRLDFSPPVQDLATAGFPLIGGRIDYIDNRAVAALVYRRHLHTINVFVWPLQGKSLLAPASSSRQGFNVKSWNKDGMQFWAVSDMQASELERLTLLLSGESGQQQLP